MRERERERDAPMQSVHLQTGVIWAQRPTTTLDVVPEQLMRAHSLTVLTPSLSNKLPYCAKASPREPTHKQDLCPPAHHPRRDGKTIMAHTRMFCNPPGCERDHSREKVRAIHLCWRYPRPCSHLAPGAADLVGGAWVGGGGSWVVQRAIAPSAAEPTRRAYFWIATSMCSSARGGCL